MSIKQCETCVFHLQDVNQAVEHYYLNRPIQCYGEITRESTVTKLCDQYTPQTDFEYNGQHWSKNWQSKEIVPDKTQDWQFETWFRRGFYYALEVANQPKSCDNCSHSNRHIINFCKENKDPNICEKYELDYLRAFDKTYYGTLCDDCTKFDFCSKKDPSKDFPNKLITSCKLFESRKEK